LLWLNPVKLATMTQLEDDLDVGCRVCGWSAMPGTSLCVGCLEIREWSRVNRAFCDLLHRSLTPDGAAPHRPLLIEALA
jgi:hypothetical protein